MRARLLQLDGQVSAVLEAEKHVVDSAVVSDQMAGQLERIAQQMGLDTGDGAVEQSDREFGFEPVKPGFTRVSGSFRCQVPSHRVEDSGE